MAGFPIKRGFVAAVTAGAIFLSSAPLPVYAALVPTDTVITESAAQANRERVSAFMARGDVQEQMRQMGVSPDEAQARVAALSDSEISRIAGRIDSAPAGGDALGVIIGGALLVFIVLLITDIAGLTKVFPWTKSAR